jgi:ribosome-binding factor A
MQRINELIHHTMADLILRETKDERLRPANITSVDVSRDLSTANVRVSCLDGAEGAAEAMMDALEHAKGWLRHEVGQRVSLRKMPELRFFHDTSAAHAEHIERLLEEVLPPADETPPEEPDSEPH